MVISIYVTIENTRSQSPGFGPKLFSRNRKYPSLGALSGMRKWSLFFPISSAILTVTYIACCLPIMLGILCVLTYVGLVLLDLSDATENDRPRYVSTISAVKNSTGRRPIPKPRGSEKTDKARDTVDIKRTQQTDPTRLQLEHEAHGLLSFYVWYLLAGARAKSGEREIVDLRVASSQCKHSRLASLDLELPSRLISDLRISNVPKVRT
jgi:hypothetical protein